MRFNRIASVFTVMMAAVAICPQFAGAQFASKKILSASASASGPVVPGKSFSVVISVSIDAPYHIQANKPKEGFIPTVVTIGAVSGLKVTSIAYPKPVTAKIGSDSLPVYEGNIQIKVALSSSKILKHGKINLPYTLKYQGCNANSCFPPGSVKGQVFLTVNPAVSKHASSRIDGSLILVQSVNTPQTGTENSAAISVPGFNATKITQFMEPKPFVEWLKKGGSQAGKADVVSDLLTRGGAGNFSVALGLIYLLGLALNLTPCVYPLIPITIGYFGRQAASGAKTGALSCFYALGMALMYSVLGVISALFGKVFGAQLQNPVVLIIFAIIMFALGLSNFDRPDGRPIWELQLPQSLTSQAKSRAGYLGALLMGLMVGLVAAPCIGPVVVALIQVVGAKQNVLLGLVTFFTLGIGLATPYLLMGFGLIKALPRAGEWMIAVKHIFGLLLFGMGIYYLRDLLGPVPYHRTLTIFVIGAGIYLSFFDKAGKSAVKFQLFKRIVGAAAILVGFMLLAQRTTPPQTASISNGKTVVFQTPKDYAELQKILTQAKLDKKEVLIDFWATWCAACKELEEKTFHDPEVAKASSSMVVLRLQLQLDEANATHDKPFVDTFGIVGLPTVVHLVPSEDKTALVNKVLQVE